MKIQKIKHAILCLYAIGIMQIIMIVYSIFVSLKTLTTLSAFDSDYPGILSNFSYIGTFGATTVFSSVLMVLIYYVIQDLKKQKTWAWIGAISVFAINSFSLAIPFCIFGLISLLHEEVRTEFMQKLEIKI